MSTTSKRIFGLDLIRATAITLVVLSHCTYILPDFNATITDGIRLLGATGVDIFFVLSGYLIGGILLKYFENGQTQFKDLVHFWKRRWFRTLPNYIVVLILNILLIYFLDQSFDEQWWLYFLFFQNFVTPHPDFFTEAWSLSIEEYAYIILPFLLFSLVSIFKKSKAKSVFIKSTIAVILLLFILKILFYFNIDIDSYKEWSSHFRKVVIYRLDAIYYGFILVYILKNVAISKFKAIVLFVFGAFLFVVLHLIIVVLNIMPQEYTFIYSVFYLPLISLSIAFVFPLAILLKAKHYISKIIRYISTRSYSIYLINYSLVLLTVNRYMQPSILALVVYLVFSLSFSELLYHLVEHPFLRLRSRIAPRK